MKSMAIGILSVFWRERNGCFKSGWCGQRGFFLLIRKIRGRIQMRKKILRRYIQ